jgi:hypothetical protein
MRGRGCVFGGLTNLGSPASIAWLCRTPTDGYADIQRLFRYAEGIKLAHEALADGPKTTSEIAADIAAAKGLDARDHTQARLPQDYSPAMAAGPAREAIDRQEAAGGDCLAFTSRKGVVVRWVACNC